MTNDDLGFWEWTYRFPDGRVVYGCDLFEFVGEHIKVKNAFCKKAEATLLT